jgi:uncharacterized protein
MKIDFYSHILPEKYFAAFRKKNPNVLLDVFKNYPTVAYVEDRIRLLNRYPDILQVLTIMQPPLEYFVAKGEDVEIAQLGNDEVANLVNRYPDKFVAAAAVLPMHDIDEALKECDRAIKDLALKGIQIYSRIGGKTLDDPIFHPLWQKMAGYDLPIWIHPLPEHYLNPNKPSKHGTFDLLFETSDAMQCLVRAGVMNDFPNIKFIMHHAGAMVPLLERRLSNVDLFKKFYCDTATYGSTAPLMCAYSFFGPDHMLFGTDTPLGPKFGCTLDVQESVERMTISVEDKEKIFLRNAVRLLKISI